MEIDIRKKQITELVESYYNQIDFLKQGSLSAFVKKALEKFLYTDLSVKEIDSEIKKAIVRKQGKSMKHNNVHTDIAVQKSNTAVVSSQRESSNSIIFHTSSNSGRELEIMINDEVDNNVGTYQVNNEDVCNVQEKPKIFTKNTDSISQDKASQDGGYADDVALSTMGLISLTFIIIGLSLIYILL